MQWLLRVMSGVLLLGATSGCEVLGIPDPEKERAAREAEGKAVGAACRHAGRPIEDCYTLNPKALKSGVFAGWKEMNDYMTENKINSQEPKLTEPEPEPVTKKRGGAAPVANPFPEPEPLIKSPEPESEHSPEKPTGVISSKPDKPAAKN